MQSLGQPLHNLTDLHPQNRLGYQTFDDLTFAKRTFADFWGRTFGALTNGDQSNDIW